jgi:transposase-like protein
VCNLSTASTGEVLEQPDRGRSRPVEADHHPKRGFKTPTTAYRTLKGIEAMHALRKGQGRIFAYGHPNPDVVIVEKPFAYA